MNTTKKSIPFEISERKILLRIIDSLVVLISINFFGKLLGLNYLDLTNYKFIWIVMLIIYLMIYGTIFDMYKLPVTISKKFVITQGVFFTSVSVVVSFLFVPIISPSLPSNRAEIVYLFLIIFLSLLSWRFFYKRFFTSDYFQKKVYIISDKSDYQKFASIIEGADSSYKVVGNFSIEDDQKVNLYSDIISKGASEVVICSYYNVDSIHAEILELFENGITVKDFVYAYEQAFNKIPVDIIKDDFYRHFPFSRFNTNRLYVFGVRIGEILFSIFGMLVLLLIIPFVYLGNLIGNKGGLFYSQERIGKNGKPFMIHKFRTMVVDAEKNGAVFATKNDMRITKFGKLMRKTRIDELPQFYNVLKGEMAVIGPRPERQVFIDKITEIMPFYTSRHAVKPGLTGWAQVNYRYGDTLEDSIEKLKYDLFYIKHRSAFIDANIIIKTIGAVIYFRGQ